MNGLFKSIAVDFEEAEEMFIEADRLVVIAVEKSFAMEFRLVDQAREMNVAAEFLVRTARMQSSHGGKKLRCRQRLRRAQRHFRLSLLFGRLRLRQQLALSEIGLTDDQLT